jgi:hypothetical protein
LGHDLADERVKGNEGPYRTDFTFALVADELPDDVRYFADGQQEIDHIGEPRQREEGNHGASSTPNKSSHTQFSADRYKNTGGMR